jgi:hypothetical protein
LKRFVRFPNKRGWPWERYFRKAQDSVEEAPARDAIGTEKAAVDLQDDRLMEIAKQTPGRSVPDMPFDRLGADMRFYVFAVHGFAEAARFTRRHVRGGRIHKQAIKVFSEAVPDLKYTRDMLVHFDNWSIGAGRGQPSGGHYVIGLGITSIDVSIGREGRGVNSAIATPEVSRLYRALEDFLVPRLAGRPVS